MQQNGDKNELLSVPGSNLFPCCIDATQLSEALVAAWIRDCTLFMMGRLCVQPTHMTRMIKKMGAEGNVTSTRPPSIRS
jgi:hypothetical protein